ncbi:MAG: uroporphyrinogen decarboxylase family protein [Ruthenibacterium sp.]
MDHKERFFATLERRPVDRPASFLGLPTTRGWQRLQEFYGVADHDAIRAKIGDDVYPIDMPYEAPNANATCTALQFAKHFTNTVDERTLTVPGFFEDSEDVADIDLFDWPDPEKYIHRASCEALFAKVPAGYPVLGIFWAAHFQDACAAFGMETALCNMITNPEMYKAVDDRITEFYLRANELYFEYAKGRIDAVLIGNDFGSQRGLMLSKEMIDTFVIPNAKRLIAQAHSYGVKVIYHSCGSIFAAIPSLIAAGADAIHPIQALAKDMSADHLQAAYGGKVSFCGGVDTQDLLVNGTPEQVRAVVRHLRELFPTGLILSPSHEAIQEDVNTQNLAAVFEETGKIY